MIRRVSDEEFNAVTALPSDVRYEHLVKQVADWSMIWSLKSPDGWVVGGDDSGRELHPVWPHERYAAAAAIDAWKGTAPAGIEIHEWLEVWTAGMVEAGRLVAVFPTDRGDYTAIDPRAFADDIATELARIE